MQTTQQVARNEVPEGFKEGTENKTIKRVHFDEWRSLGVGIVRLEYVPQAKQNKQFSSFDTGIGRKQTFEILVRDEYCKRNGQIRVSCGVAPV